MATDKRQSRETALLEWSRTAAMAGYTVPSDAEVRIISENPDSWLKGTPSAVVLDWSDTIAYIVHQVKFGMDPHEVIRHLPEEVRAPKGGDTSRVPKAQPEPAHIPSVPSTPDPPVKNVPPDTAIAALFAWRARRSAEGMAAADTIKDVTFQNLIKYKSFSAELVRKQLRGAAIPLAEEISEILLQFFGKPEPEAAAEPVAPPRPARHSADRQSTAQSPSAKSPTKAAARPAKAESTLDRLETADFCEYAYLESDVVPSDIKFKKVGDAWDLSWTAYAGAGPDDVVLYRIVSGEGQVPYKPEAGELLGVSLDCAWEDSRPFVSAVRTFQIWCHVGHDVDEARMQQPMKVAEGEIVSPVADFALMEDEGHVVGQWNVWSGTKAVRIHRIPLDGSTPVAHNPTNQICVGEPNLTGFVDQTAVRGTRYLYRVMSEVDLGGSTRLSQTTQGEILVSVVLTSVHDLTVDDGGIEAEKPHFDLMWSDPSSGRVVIYRTERAPDAGLLNSELPETALELQGLTSATRLGHPAVAGDAGSSRMKGVPWPNGWDRAYLTPVTVLNGSARVGSTTVQTRPIPPVKNFRIVERTDKQIATFGWPASAASVNAYIGPRGLPYDAASCGSPAEEISAKMYRRDGGLTFKSPLPPGGCSVHLVPVAFSAGEQILGTATTVEYNGLTRIYYDLRHADGPGIGTRIKILLTSELEVDSPPPFVLVTNRDRLPLSARDGNSVPLSGDTQGRPVMQCTVQRLNRDSQDSGWGADLAGREGFMRLFVDLDSVFASTRTFALIDPPVSRLRLDTGQAP